MNAKQTVYSFKVDYEQNDHIWYLEVCWVKYKNINIQCPIWEKYMHQS